MIRRGLTVGVAGLLLSLASVLSAADTTRVRSQGLHPFGSSYLLYKDSSRHYPCANPDAPKGGEIRLAWHLTFNKKNPFSIGGAPIPGYFLAFEPLAEVSFDDDDSLSVYGKLAEWFEISPDGKELLIRLRSEARFSDGEPVTADDVVFSWNITGDPSYDPYTRIALNGVKTVEKIDRLTVRVTFDGSSRDLPFNFCMTFYIIPQHIYGRPGTNFGKDFDDLDPVGSGPYTLERDETGAYATWVRNPNYWGANLWLNRGRFNFDRITFRIYTDASIQREAFAAGLIDVVDVASAREWAVEFTPEKSTAIRNHWILRHAFDNTRIPSVQAYVFNLRRPAFHDLAVRRAIASLMDFDSLNRDLFYGQYERYSRYFDADQFPDTGPAEGKMLDELLRLRAKYNRPDSGIIHVPKEAITVGPRFYDRDYTNRPIPIADRRQFAAALLDSAGWLYDPERGVRMKDGIPLRFEVLMRGQADFRRAMLPFFDELARIGVQTADKSVQYPEYQERSDKFDYDMIVERFIIMECPGDDQKNYWHSSGADQKGSMNVCGVRNPAIDETIDLIKRAESPEEVFFYCGVLDRLICANAYIIPQWNSRKWRTLYWNRFGVPGKIYGGATSMWNSHNFFWADPAKEAVLDDAMKHRTALPDLPCPPPARWEDVK